MVTKVEELKAKYGENSDKFAIALMMEIYNTFGENVATDFINGNYKNLPFNII